MAKTKASKPATDLAEDLALWESLDACLSQEELRRTLAAALTSLDSAGLERLDKRLGPQTGLTVRRALGAWQGRAQTAPPGSAAPAGRRATAALSPGMAKIRELWERAWEEWHDCLADTWDEGGRFVQQDAHWEPPYVDTCGLSAALEAIAARLADLVPQVVECRLVPDFDFLETLQEGIEGIGADDGWQETDLCNLFGPVVTGCMLRWEWLARGPGTGKGRSRSAFEWLERIRRAEDTAGGWGLDEEAIATFVLGLPKSDQREILAGLQESAVASLWKGMLDDTGAGWFALFKELTRRWDPDHHTALCLRHVADDWSLAIPLAEEALGRGQPAAAQIAIERAFQALLDLRPDESWDPAAGLLAARAGSRVRGADSRLAHFLTLCSEVAERCGKPEQACVLAVQAEAAASIEDWDRMLTAFASAAAAGHEAAVEPLFADWKRLVQTWSADADLPAGAGATAGWVGLLVDAAREGPSSAPQFQQRLRAWLASAGASSKSFQQARRAVESLTVDLDCAAEVRQLSMALAEALRVERPDDSLLQRSRRTWLERLGARAVFPDLAALWQMRAADALPDPASATGSRYEDCARWLASVYELNRVAYDQVIRAWRRDHARRRNLWVAISRRKLPW